MPLPLLALASAAIPQMFKAAQGISQLQKAKKVQVESTITPADREGLALLRQGATAAMPDLGAAQNSLAQTQAATLAGASRLSSTPSGILGALAASDGRRQLGLSGLDTQNQQFQQNGRRALSAGLFQLSGIQRRDQETASRTRAALKNAGNQNLFGGIEGGANTAAYFGSQPNNSADRLLALQNQASKGDFDPLMPKEPHLLLRNMTNQQLPLLMRGYQRG